MSILIKNVHDNMECTSEEMAAQREREAMRVEGIGLPWRVGPLATILAHNGVKIGQMNATYAQHEGSCAFNDERAEYVVRCVNMGLSSDGMDMIRREVSAWANTAFPHRTSKDVAIKLVEETTEVLRNSRHSDEIADVLILALDLCTLAGHDPAEIVRKKMIINRKRRWEYNSNTGTHQHSVAAVHVPTEAREDE